MPIFTILCPLCGAPIDESADLPQWLREFRAIYTTLEDWDMARISQTGRRRQFDDIIPLDTSIHIDVSESTVDDNWVQIRLMRSQFGEKYPPRPPIIPRPVWGYPFHVHCWDILLANYAHLDTESAIQALFRLCRSHPIQLGVMNWGHDYGGIVKYDADIKSLFPGEEGRLLNDCLIGNEYLCDPVNIPELTLELSCVGGGQQGDQPRKVAITAPTTNDLFGLLPSEILIEILIRLQSRDVRNLRFSSKVVANTLLPDIFWQSRFWLGNEFSYVFEIASSKVKQGQWKTIFDKVKRLESLPAMRNRKRIWKLASGLGDLTTAAVDAQKSYNPAHSSAIDPKTTCNLPGWCTAKSALCYLNTLFRHGSRPLYDSTVAIVSPLSDVQISSVRLNNRSYVSGLRFTKGNGLMAQLGYHVSQSDRQVTWPAAPPASFRSLVGFLVAADSRGIRGLALVYAGGITSNWIGDHQRVPKKMITSSGQTVQEIKVGFDALKLVSISIKDSITECHIRDANATSSKVSSLWYPELPEPNISFLGGTDKRLSVQEEHIPRSLCLFGGVNGQYLPFLTHLSIWTTDRTSFGLGGDRTHIWGIEFHYGQNVNGNKSILLGKIPGPETCEPRSYEFTLDSRNGERITGLDALYEDCGFTFSLIIHTNHGRKMQIPPDAAADLKEEDFFVESLRVRNGTIIGLWGVLCKHLVFQKIGVAYIES